MLGVRRFLSDNRVCGRVDDGREFVLYGISRAERWNHVSNISAAELSI
jgi:hypothetical protein